MKWNLVFIYKTHLGRSIILKLFTETLKNQELSCCQLCHKWWLRWLPLRQHTVPPLTTRMTSDNGDCVIKPICRSHRYFILTNDNPEFIHWKEKFARITTLIITGDVEDKLQLSQCRPGQSFWRPFRFREKLLCHWMKLLQQHHVVVAIRTFEF